MLGVVAMMAIMLPAMATGESQPPSNDGCKSDLKVENVQFSVGETLNVTFNTSKGCARDVTFAVYEKLCESDGFCLPQELFDSITQNVQPKTSYDWSLKLPACGGIQGDLAYGGVITDLSQELYGSRLIEAIHANLGTECEPPVEEVPATITVVGVCADNEPARYFTVTAGSYADGLFVESNDSTSYRIEALTGTYEPGETRTYTLPVSEYDFDTWNLFGGLEGDAGFLAEASATAGTDCTPPEETTTTTAPPEATTTTAPPTVEPTSTTAPPAPSTTGAPPTKTPQGEGMSTTGALALMGLGGLALLVALGSGLWRRDEES